jgi:hypothetical protein
VLKRFGQSDELIASNVPVPAFSRPRILLPVMVPPRSPTTPRREHCLTLVQPSAALEERHKK